ncbi:siphovirus Gp157 family protein [Leptolyngbya sp. PCC 6406]|uniref:siphovirus Gp157 family protein n=1 Tax=Leptolyngbya sp. PCC 6406 TaxID=1173264 RepID=UPI0002AC52E2|nr:siphovirus Gp157 family protein [Leptolyngbya sp. PCC 6406]
MVVPSQRRATPPPSVVERSLSLVSRSAARLWRLLNDSPDAETEAELLEQLWQTQAHQAQAVDDHVALRHHIDAELAALQARRDRLMAVHDQALERLSRWATTLDQRILTLNQMGTIGREVVGQTYRIRIKLNPPACQVLDEAAVPEEYVTVEVKESTKVNKQAIKAAWKQGRPVAGTEVTRKQKVVYEMAPTSLERMAMDATGMNEP